MIVDVRLESENKELEPSRHVGTHPDIQLGLCMHTKTMRIVDHLRDTVEMMVKGTPPTWKDEVSNGVAKGTVIWVLCRSGKHRSVAFGRAHPPR